MQNTMLQWKQDVLQAKRKQAMPILSFPAAQLLDVSVAHLVADSALQADAMVAVAARCPTLGAVSAMDLSVEAECFGAQIQFGDDEVPAVVGSLVGSLEDAKKLAVPQVGTARTGVYLEAMRQATARITDRPVFAGMIGPFSLAGRLLDVMAAMMLCYDEPALVHTVMETCTAFLIAYARAYREAGAAGILIAEPLTGMLSPALAEEFSSPYVKQIVDAVQTDDFLLFYHNCGNNTVQMLDSLLSCGAAGYHFGNAISMGDILPRMPKDTLAMGNLDPAGLLRNGTPAAVREATLALLEAYAAYPQFVLSSGCDIPPAAPWENIDAFFAAADEFYDA